MITLPAIIIHASRANKFSRDGDDKNYYRLPPPPLIAVFSRVQQVCACVCGLLQKKKKEVIACSITVDVRQTLLVLRIPGFVSQIIDRDGKVLP